MNEKNNENINLYPEDLIEPVLLDAETESQLTKEKSITNLDNDPIAGVEDNNNKRNISYMNWPTPSNRFSYQIGNNTFYFVRTDGTICFVGDMCYYGSISMQDYINSQYENMPMYLSAYNIKNKYDNEFSSDVFHDLDFTVSQSKCFGMKDALYDNGTVNFNSFEYKFGVSGFIESPLHIYSISLGLSSQYGYSNNVLSTIVYETSGGIRSASFDDVSDGSLVGYDKLFDSMNLNESVFNGGIYKINCPEAKSNSINYEYEIDLSQYGLSLSGRVYPDLSQLSFSGKIINNNIIDGCYTSNGNIIIQGIKQEVPTTLIVDDSNSKKAYLFILYLGSSATSKKLQVETDIDKIVGNTNNTFTINVLSQGTIYASSNNSDIEINVDQMSRTISISVDPLKIDKNQIGEITIHIDGLDDKVISVELKKILVMSGKLDIILENNYNNIYNLKTNYQDQFINSMNGNNYYIDKSSLSYAMYGNNYSFDSYDLKLIPTSSYNGLEQRNTNNVYTNDQNDQIIIENFKSNDFISFVLLSINRNDNSISSSYIINIITSNLTTLNLENITCSGYDIIDNFDETDKTRRLYIDRNKETALLGFSGNLSLYVPRGGMHKIDVPRNINIKWLDVSNIFKNTTVDRNLEGIYCGRFRAEYKIGLSGNIENYAGPNYFYNYNRLGSDLNQINEDDYSHMLYINVVDELNIYDNFIVEVEQRYIDTFRRIIVNNSENIEGKDIYIPLNSIFVNNEIEYPETSKILKSQNLNSIYNNISLYTIIGDGNTTNSYIKIDNIKSNSIIPFSILQYSNFHNRFDGIYDLLLITKPSTGLNFYELNEGPVLDKYYNLDGLLDSENFLEREIDLSNSNFGFYDYSYNLFLPNPVRTTASILNKKIYHKKVPEATVGFSGSIDLDLRTLGFLENEQIYNIGFCGDIYYVLQSSNINSEGKVNVRIDSVAEEKPLFITSVNSDYICVFSLGDSANKPSNPLEKYGKGIISGTGTIDDPYISIMNTDYGNSFDSFKLNINGQYDSYDHFFANSLLLPSIITSYQLIEKSSNIINFLDDGQYWRFAIDKTQNTETYIKCKLDLRYDTNNHFENYYKIIIKTDGVNYNFQKWGFLYIDINDSITIDPFNIYEISPSIGRQRFKIISIVSSTNLCDSINRQQVMEREILEITNIKNVGSIHISYYDDEFGVYGKIVIFVITKDIDLQNSFIKDCFNFFMYPETFEVPYIKEIGNTLLIKNAQANKNSIVLYNMYSKMDQYYYGYSGALYIPVDKNVDILNYSNNQVSDHNMVGIYYNKGSYGSIYVTETVKEQNIGGYFDSYSCLQTNINRSNVNKQFCLGFVKKDYSEQYNISCIYTCNDNNYALEKYRYILDFMNAYSTKDSMWFDFTVADMDKIDITPADISRTVDFNTYSSIDVSNEYIEDKNLSYIGIVFDTSETYDNLHANYYYNPSGSLSIKQIELINNNNSYGRLIGEQHSILKKSNITVNVRSYLIPQTFNSTAMKESLIDFNTIYSKSVGSAFSLISNTDLVVVTKQSDGIFKILAKKSGIYELIQNTNGDTNILTLTVDKLITDHTFSIVESTIHDVDFKSIYSLQTIDNMTCNSNSSNLQVTNLGNGSIRFKALQSGTYTATLNLNGDTSTITINASDYNFDKVIDVKENEVKQIDLRSMYAGIDLTTSNITSNDQNLVISKVNYYTYKIKALVNGTYTATISIDQNVGTITVNAADVDLDLQINCNASEVVVKDFKTIHQGLDLTSLTISTNNPNLSVVNRGNSVYAFKALQSGTYTATISIDQNVGTITVNANKLISDQNFTVTACKTLQQDFKLLYQSLDLTGMTITSNNTELSVVNRGNNIFDFKALRSGTYTATLNLNGDTSTITINSNKLIRDYMFNDKVEFIPFLHNFNLDYANADLTNLTCISSDQNLEMVNRGNNIFDFKALRSGTYTATLNLNGDTSTITINASDYKENSIMEEEITSFYLHRCYGTRSLLNNSFIFSFDDFRKMTAEEKDGNIYIIPKIDYFIEYAKDNFDFKEVNVPSGKVVISVSGSKREIKNAYTNDVYYDVSDVNCIYLSVFYLKDNLTDKIVRISDANVINIAQSNNNYDEFNKTYINYFASNSCVLCDYESDGTYNVEGIIFKIPKNSNNIIKVGYNSYNKYPYSYFDGVNNSINNMGPNIVDDVKILSNENNIGIYTNNSNIDYISISSLNDSIENISLRKCDKTDYSIIKEFRYTIDVENFSNNLDNYMTDKYMYKFYVRDSIGRTGYLFSDEFGKWHFELEGSNILLLLEEES